MDKRDILKLILSGEVEPEKLPLLLKAANIAGKTLFALKTYTGGEKPEPDDLYSTWWGMFGGDTNAPMYTGAELDAISAELGIRIPVIVFSDCMAARDQDGNIASEDVDKLFANG